MARQFLPQINAFYSVFFPGSQFVTNMRYGVGSEVHDSSRRRDAGQLVLRQQDISGYLVVKIWVWVCVDIFLDSLLLEHTHICVCIFKWLNLTHLYFQAVREWQSVRKGRKAIWRLHTSKGSHPSPNRQIFVPNSLWPHPPQNFYLFGTHQCLRVLALFYCQIYPQYWNFAT